MSIEPRAADAALHKRVHTNENRVTASHITDGNPDTFWSSVLYPAYAQIDLAGCYHLSEVVIHTPQKGASRFDVYASLDGANFATRDLSQRIRRGTLRCGGLWRALRAGM